MNHIRNLFKNDFIVVILAVFISWPCCNGFRLELEKKSSAASDTVAFVAAAHVMGTARGQDVQSGSLRILKTPFIVFDFQKLFKLPTRPGSEITRAHSSGPNTFGVSTEIIFSHLLI